MLLKADVLLARDKRAEAVKCLEEAWLAVKANSTRFVCGPVLMLIVVKAFKLLQSLQPLREDLLFSAFLDEFEEFAKDFPPSEVLQSEASDRLWEAGPVRFFAGITAKVEDHVEKKATFRKLTDEEVTDFIILGCEARIFVKLRDSNPEKRQQQQVQQQQEQH